MKTKLAKPQFPRFAVQTHDGDEEWYTVTEFYDRAEASEEANSGRWVGPIRVVEVNS